MAFLVKEGGIEVSCELNTTPGTSSTTLPYASSTYVIEPSTTSDCSSNCATLSNTATYNAFPTCGAATCDSGYNLSGSGSSATCVAQPSSSGGSPSHSSPASDPDNSTSEEQSYEETEEGNIITNETSITRVDGHGTETKSETIITVFAKTSNDETISLDTSATSDISKIKLTLPSGTINSALKNHGSSTKVKFSITSHNADVIQKSNHARGGQFLVGFDVFKIDMFVNETEIKTFDDDLLLTFNVSGVKYKENLKAYYFDEAKGQWIIAGSGGGVDGDNLYVYVNHLTDFALIRPIETVTQEEILSDRATQWQQVLNDANIVFESGSNLDIIISHNGAIKNINAQSDGMEKYTKKLTDGTDLDIDKIYAINNFIVYGTKSSKFLGAGERAGVVNSYKKAFGRLPKTEEEWKDCIAIGSGRWPAEESLKAVETAKEQFKKVYLRDANMNQINDNAAVTVMAYGLRPSNRNLDSEAVAIKTFRHIYEYNPSSALDWDIVRAIAYSGATR